MTDIVERLRAWPENVLAGASLCEEAADEISRLRVVETLYAEACDAAYDRGTLLARIGELEALARDVLEGCRAADLMNAEPYGKAQLWERLNVAVNTAMRLEIHDAIRGESPSVRSPQGLHPCPDVAGEQGERSDRLSSTVPAVLPEKS